MQVSLTVMLRRFRKELVRSTLASLETCFLADADLTEGYYQYLNGWDAGPSNVWFSYDVNTGSSTYLLFDCPIYSKDRILRRAHDDVFAILSNPFAIDMLIAEECCYSWESLVSRFREELLHWVRLVNHSSDLPLTSLTGK